MTSFRLRRSILIPALFLGLVSCNPVPAPPTAAPEPTAAPTAAPTATPSLRPGDYERTVDVDGAERSYLLHVPAGIDGLGPLPAVFVFHGWSGTPEDMVVTTDFNILGDQNGFLAAYPRGTGTGNNDLSWNAGACCGAALAGNVDETAFVRGMLADLGAIARVDPKRIYATGLSNGAFLSYYLACEMSGTFAAVAPVAGVLTDDPCRPEQPVSVVHIHGINDVTVPYAGGGSVIPGGFLSVEETIQTWAKLDGCGGSPLTDEPFKNVAHTAYGDCRAGTSVELYAINYFGHRWPLINTFPASRTIWDFFAAHPKR
jgi:polyhydroxybutyrate depolymerase